MAKRTKRQHYVAQFHLAGFTQPSEKHRTEMLWLADTETKNVRQTSTRNVGVEELFYDWRDTSWWKEGGAPPEIEQFIGKIEERAAPIFRRFAAIDFKNLRLTDEDRYHISNYIGLQLTRTPLALELVDGTLRSVVDHKIQELADDPAFEEKWRRFIAGRSDAAGFPGAEVARQRIKASPPRLVPHRDRSLGLSLFAGFKVSERMFEMPWCMLVAPEALFFTSDHPVFMHSVNNDPRTVEVSFAVSSRVRLVAHQKPRPEGRGNIIYLTERGTETCNRLVLQAVRRFFFCPTEPLAHWTLANYADDDTMSILDSLDALDSGP
jgi:hypothetical protein